MFSMWFGGGVALGWWGAVINTPTSFLECVVYGRHKACSKRRKGRSVQEKNKATSSANERRTVVSCECACELIRDGDTRVPSRARAQRTSHRASCWVWHIRAV